MDNHERRVDSNNEDLPLPLQGDHLPVLSEGSVPPPHEMATQPEVRRLDRVQELHVQMHRASYMEVAESALKAVGAFKSFTTEFQCFHTYTYHCKSCRAETHFCGQRRTVVQCGCVCQEGMATWRILPTK